MGMGVRAWLKEHFGSPDAIYGLILFAALIGGASESDDAPADSFEVLLVAVLSLIVFWGAHVFAGTIATHGVRDGREITLGAATWESMKHSSGMLYASVPPSLILLLGVAKFVSTDDAVSLALLAAMVILGVLGYRAFAQRGAHPAVRILGGIGTALFGLLIIVLNEIVH
jgi:hypothetical protein